MLDTATASEAIADSMHRLEAEPVELDEAVALCPINSRVKLAKSFVANSRKSWRLPLLPKP